MGRASFVVHKHHARSLHYDLRLEIDGVLASFAVPRGPSYDPAEKRLAVETEEHPLSYGSFEGRIPEGEYGAGDSLLWDRGTWDTVPPGQAVAQRRAGDLLLDLRGEKLRGRWHLVRTHFRDKPSWLLFKARDETARSGYDVLSSRPESVGSGRRLTRGPARTRERPASLLGPDELLKRVGPPMLATLADEGEVPPGYRLEVKYDGFRALAALSGGQVALRSRNGIDLAGRFPSVVQAVRTLGADELVLDGEIVARGSRRSSFQDLQRSHGQASYVAFDLLWLDGADYRGLPLRERRALLESVASPGTQDLSLAEEVRGPVRASLTRAARQGSEGIMAKDPTSSYQGLRSRAWLKVKVAAGQELAIVGFVPLSTGEQGVGALLVAVREGTRYRYAGKVGTGYTFRERRDLYRRLERDRVKSPPLADPPRLRGVRWVRPRLVAEVAFTEWTRDHRLRHPSYKGLREDKKPEEAVREGPPAP